MKSIILLFNFTRGSITESFMKTFIVIIPFDIFKESQTNLLNTFEGAAMVQPFPFQFPSEAFIGGVVPAFALLLTSSSLHIMAMGNESLFFVTKVYFTSTPTQSTQRPF